MSARSRLISSIKRLVIRSRILTLLRPLAGLLVFSAYLSKVVAWSSRAGGSVPRAVFETRTELYEFLSREVIGPRAIDYLEFGVWKGASLKWWLEHNDNPSSVFVGFDTFTGLPEDWGYYKKHHFDVGGRRPHFDDPRVEFEAGLFQHTLVGFLRRRPLCNVKVINIDADLYNSTLYVLASLSSCLRPDDVVIFDEFLAWRTPADQFRAFEDFTSAFPVRCEFVGAACNFEKVAVRIVGPVTESGETKAPSEVRTQNPTTNNAEHRPPRKQDFRHRDDE